MAKGGTLYYITLHPRDIIQQQIKVLKDSHNANPNLTQRQHKS